MRKISTLAIGMLISSFALASNVETSNVTLTGGPIPPKGTLNIKLNDLVTSAPYQVTCSILNSDFTKEKDVAVMAAYVSSGTGNKQPKFCLNGEKFTSVAYLQNKHAENTLMAVPVINVSGSETLSITNLDDTANLTVNNCIAVPAVK